MKLENESPEQTLEYIIKHTLIFHHFQPIFNLLSNKVYGFECLLRSHYSHDPSILFDVAKKTKSLNKIDLLSIQRALQTVNGYVNESLMKDKYVFMNIFPSTLSLPSFYHFLEIVLPTLNVPANRIVLEINEIEEIPDFYRLKEAVTSIQNLGIAIGIDDIGTGTSPFGKLIDLQPDFIKLDKYFSDDLHISPKKQKMVKLLLDFCTDNNIKVILEGIEEPVDLEVAMELGVLFGQGFLLGKPNLFQNFIGKR